MRNSHHELAASSAGLRDDMFHADNKRRLNIFSCMRRILCTSACVQSHKRRICSKLLRLLLMVSDYRSLKCALVLGLSSMNMRLSKAS